MKSNLFSTVLICLATSAGGVPALAAEEPLCRSAGPGAEFCTGGSFTRVDTGDVTGISFWLDEAGYLSKVLVQDGVGDGVDQAQIEQQILAMVSGQADDIGRDFEFSDLSSTTAGGAPFGTISYALAMGGGRQSILHSYVAVNGIIVQVISQIALKGVPNDATALRYAHHRALEAIALTTTDPAL